MSEILREWMLMFGLTLSSKESLFVKQISDGVIIATILHHLGIITTGQFSKVLPSSKKDTVENNFKYILSWLKLINIEPQNQKVIRIVNTETDIALNILFQLYIKLEGKIFYNLSDSLVKEQRILENQTRFEVNPVLDENGNDKNNIDAYVPKYIENNQHLLDWHILQKKELVQSCKEKRKLYESYFQTENKKLINISDKHSRVDLPDDIYLLPKDTYESNYDVLLSDSKRIQKIQIPVPVQSESMKFLKTLSNKHKFLEDEEKIKVKIYEFLLLKILKRNLKEDYEEYEEYVSRKLLKLSYYEKQLIAKLLAVKEQRDIIINNQEELNSNFVNNQEYISEYNDFQNKETLWEKFHMCNIEKNRCNELDRRLFQEEERIREERNKNFCRKCVEETVNVALCIAQYKEYHHDVPSWRLVHDWMALFIKDKGIFTVLEHIEELVCYDGKSNLEESFRIELERQNAIEDRSVVDFFRREFPFDLDSFPEMEEYNKKTKLGEEPLSKIISEMLLVKYPKPKLLPTDEIPKVSTAACIVNLRNASCINFLNKLLFDKGILLVEISDAINYCLNSYKEEINGECGDETIRKISEITLQFLKRKREGNVQHAKPKRKGEKSGGRKKRLLLLSAGQQVKDEENQTPNKFLCEEQMLYSAELGKIAYEQLSLGGALDSRMLINMFVEYLKSRTNINGWVLLNFPENVTDAIILEKTLSGRFPDVPENVEISSSIEDLCNLELRNLNIVPDFDSEAKFRQSIFIDLTPKNDPLSKTECYLNKFIFLKEQKNENECNCIEKEKIKKLISLKEFYSERCSNYSLTYKKMNYYVVKQLGKFLAGDTVVHPKTSLELFGDTVKYVELNVCSKSKSGMDNIEEKLIVPQNETVITEHNYNFEPEKVNAIKKDRKKKNAVTLIKEEKATQIPDSASILGSTNRQYVSTEIPSGLATVLSTMWENMEEVFYNDIKQLNYSHRIRLKLHLPFVTFFNSYVESFMCQPDRKQVILQNYQVKFNSVKDDIRNDEEMKAELHYRISLLRENLCKVSREKFQEAIESRKAVISDNWLGKLMTEKFCSYELTLITILERFIATLQIVIDYNATVVAKVPRLQVLPLENIFSTTCDFSLEEGIQNIKYVSNILNGEKTEFNPLNFFVIKYYDIYFSILNEYKEKILKIFKEYLSLSTKNIKTHKGKANKINNKKQDDLDRRNALEKIYEDCINILEGEYSRTIADIYLIKTYCLFSWNDTVDYHKYRLDVSSEMMTNIYNKEIENIDKICEILRWAVESEKKMQPRLVLDQTTIYVEPDVIFYEDPLPLPELPTCEKLDDYIFTINQLNKLTDIFETTGPRGYIPEPYFVQLFQDIIVQEAEDGLEIMVPRKWCKLSTSDISLINLKFFGNVTYVPWKDFIIYNMYLSFPSEKQLLTIKKQFEKHDPDLTQNVLLYQFNNVKFWFETKRAEKAEKIRFHRIKQLLARLFTVKKETVNYINLLISFCKDDKLVKGIAKAATLVAGKPVCWNYAEGKNFVERLTTEETKCDKDSFASGIFLTEEKSNENYYFLEGYEDCILLDDYLFLSSKYDFVNNQPLEDFSDENSSSSSEESSNVEDKIYFLTEKTLLLIFNIIFPYTFKARLIQLFKHSVKKIYDSCRRTDLENHVLMHEFLNNYYFLQLFKKNHKFLDINPKNIIINLLLANKDVPTI